MGHLTYGNTAEPLEVEDRLLAHLRAVALTKLRRNESFALTLPASRGVVETLWIHSAIPLRFSVDESVATQRPLLTAMMEAANSAGGLDLGREEFASGATGPRYLHAMSA